jgi:hypothetical protein
VSSGPRWPVFASIIFTAGLQSSIGIFSAMGLLVAATLEASPAAAQKGLDTSPWTPERTRAVVRIEVPQAAGPSPSIGTGVLVQGLSERNFVLTSTHVVLPDHNAEMLPPEGCLSLKSGTRLFQGNSGGPEVRPRCAYHLGADVSLIELEPRDDKYPVLSLSAVELAVGDGVTLAGFPLGYARALRSGKVSLTTGPDGTIVTDILTAPGMSGGPYLAPGGVVVGLHRGGAKYTAGFAHMTPISVMRTALEKHLPNILAASSPPAPPGEAAAAQCRKQKEGQLRTELKPFSKSWNVRCASGSKRQALFSYDIRQEMAGYAISGFVSHQDNVQFGEIGMLRYEAKDPQYITGVNILLSCDASTAGAPEEGWAETTLSGFAKKIIDQEALEVIKKACQAAKN